MKQEKPTKSELDKLFLQLEETKKKLRNPYFTTEEIESLQIEEAEIKKKIRNLAGAIQFFMTD